MIRPLYSILNINNLKKNLLIIRSMSKKKKIWLVLKANAYGHGIKNIYNYIYDKVDGFAVVTLNEAILLRNLGFKKPILLLEGFFDYKDINLCLKFDLTIVLHSYWQFILLKKIKYKNKKINVYLKYNYDLNRLGFNFFLLKKVFIKLKYIKLINDISLIIHLSKYNIDYINFFYLNILNKFKNILFKNISIFSSYGLILNNLCIGDNWLRIGILLYGCSPTGDYNDIKKYGFKPVMSLLSKIIGIQYVNSNIGVGYGHSYFTNSKKIIGIVACGYADGYPRQLSNNSFVLVNGFLKARIIGNISMDMMMIDLSNNYNIKIGSLVELWGKNLCIDYIAKLANTINYNLICNINHKRIIFKFK